MYDSKLKLYIQHFDKGGYPDCMVVCGISEFWNEQDDVTLNPDDRIRVLTSEMQVGEIYAGIV